MWGAAAVSMSVSQGQSQSQSQSAPVLVPQPALGYEGQWNSALQSLQQQQYQWAQQQYGKNSQLTDQMVSNAANFANPERIHQDMGSAEAGVSQSMDAQRQALNQTLQSYGINPGDPKYAGALAASRTAQGAAMAAAGQTANRADVAAGNTLKQQALQDTYQNTASGANILGTSQGYSGQGVQNVKFAPLGQVAQSVSQSLNRSQSTPGVGNVGGGGGGGTSGGGGGGRPASSGGGGSPRSSGGGGGGAHSNPMSSGGGSGGGGSGGSGSGGGGGYYDPGMQQAGDPYGSGDGYGGNSDSAGGANDYSTNPDDNYGTGDNSTGAGGGNDYSTGDPNSYYSPDSYSGDSSGGGYSGDSGGGGDPGYSDSGYAAGGEVGGIPDGTTGGHVDSNMSPSRGAITDDVPARLNAEEFVVPRDVARWKGEEFFHKLIEQSRKGREGVTAKPEQKPIQLKDAVAHMRGQGFQSRPVNQAFAGGAIPDGSEQPLMQRNVA